MPMHVTPSRLSSGRAFLHVVASGEVNGTHAQALMDIYGPGKPHFGEALLAVVEHGASFSAEARKIFSVTDDASKANQAPVAIVVTSTPMRVMLTFILKITGSAHRTRFFAAETEARRWLEDRVVAA